MHRHSTGTEQEQEPCCLQAVKGGHALQQAVLRDELAGYEGIVPEGVPAPGAVGGGTSRLARRVRSRLQGRRCWVVPRRQHSRSSLVQPDTRMGPKRGGEGIVEHPDAFWRGDDVNVVEERKHGLPSWSWVCRSCKAWCKASA